jgi:hypothetical protein
LIHYYILLDLSLRTINLIILKEVKLLGMYLKKADDERKTDDGITVQDLQSWLLRRSLNRQDLK